jgi:hypothetical protein
MPTDRITLRHGFQGAFSRSAQPRSPLLSPGAVGLRLHADGLVRDEDLLMIPLFVTATLSQPEYASYSRPADAITLVVEDLGARATAAFTLVDPTLIPYESTAPNYRAGSRWGSPKARCTTYVSFVLELGVPPAPDHPGLFLRACLAEHVSNTLAVGLGDLSVTSYWEGRPHAVTLAPVSPQ